MGEIKQKFAGIRAWRGGIQVGFHWNGKRHQPTLQLPATPKNFKYAANLKAEIERLIAVNQYSLEKYSEHFPNSHRALAGHSEKRQHTFRSLADKWLKTIEHLSVGTKTKYVQALNFWLKEIGDEPIHEVVYSTIAATINKNGWKPKHRNNVLIPLRRVMEMAYLDGYIDTNPATKVKNSKVQLVPPDPLTIEELEDMLKYMGKYDRQIPNFFEFAFFTGMRPSEQIALKWTDIDFENKLARVQRARSFKTEHETKTYKVRDVELSARALDALSRQKEATLLKNGYIFENPVTNKPYHEERPLREAYWTPALKALGLRHRHYYQTRHTFATLCLMAGCNPMWVAKQMGHANMQMLLTVYSKWIQGADNSKEKNKLDFAAPKPKPWKLLKEEFAKKT